MGVTLWSHRREQPCPGALHPLQPLPAVALHSAGCPGRLTGWAHDMWPLPGPISGAHPVAVRATSLQVDVPLCARCLFCVCFTVWTRGCVAVSSLLGTCSVIWSVTVPVGGIPHMATRWSPSNLSPMVAICGQRGLSRGPAVTALAPPAWQSVAIALSLGLSPRMSRWMDGLPQGRLGRVRGQRRPWLQVRRRQHCGLRWQRVSSPRPFWLR